MEVDCELVTPASAAVELPRSALDRLRQRRPAVPATPGRQRLSPPVDIPAPALERLVAQTWGLDSAAPWELAGNGSVVVYQEWRSRDVRYDVLVASSPNSVDAAVYETLVLEDARTLLAMRTVADPYGVFEVRTRRTPIDADRSTLAAMLTLRITETHRAAWEGIEAASEFGWLEEERRALRVDGTSIHPDLEWETH